MKSAQFAVIAAVLALGTTVTLHPAVARGIDHVRPVVGLWPPTTGDIATGNSPAPSIAEWNAAPEVGVTKSSAYHCETKLVREWFRSSCVAYDKWTLLPARSVSTGASAPLFWTDPGGQKASAIVQVRKGQVYVLRFAWNPGNVTSDLTIDLRGNTAVAGFSP